MRGTEYPDRSCLPSGQNEDQVSFFEAIRYIRSHVPPDAVILSGKPATAFSLPDSLAEAAEAPGCLESLHAKSRSEMCLRGQ